MNIIKPGFVIEERDELRGGLKIIESAGRTCYKSEDKVTDTSAEGFVKGIIRSRHLSVLEHGDMIFEIGDYHIQDNVIAAMDALHLAGLKPPMLTMTRIGSRCLISGNIRAWLELFASGSIAARYFIGFFDPIYITGMGFEDADAEPDPRIRQIRYADIHDPLEQRAHVRQTVRFTIDRGISHEFVRHRVMSFSQESTRYCNYSQGKFGREITVIAPCYLVEGSQPYELWRRSCMSDEVEYFTLLNMGLSPQEARAVLPNSTKTELMMTGTIRQWDHFFDLRARQLTGPAHPQAVEVAEPLMQEMVERWPEAFIG